MNNIKIDKIIKDLEIEGFNMARMISHSKSFYRKTFPYNQVYLLYVHSQREEKSQ